MSDSASQHLLVALEIQGEPSSEKELVDWVIACLNCNTNHRQAQVRLAFTTADKAVAELAARLDVAQGLIEMLLGTDHAQKSESSDPAAPERER